MLKMMRMRLVLTLVLVGLLVMGCSDPHTPEEYISMVQNQSLQGLEGMTIAQIMETINGVQPEWKFYRNSDEKCNNPNDPPIGDSSRAVSATWTSSSGDAVEVMFKIHRDAKPEDKPAIFELAMVQIAGEAYYGKTALTMINKAAGGTYDEVYGQFNFEVHG